MSRRLCFALDLVNDPGKIAEYEQFHAPGRVWPQIVDDIHAQGIEGMEIWRTGDRMVMIATVADDYPKARDRAHPLQTDSRDPPHGNRYYAHAPSRPERCPGWQSR